MTTSDYRKVMKQLEGKPSKYKKYQKHNAPKKRSCGIAKVKCSRCGTHRGHINKYGINVCRRCFREIATNIGFKKFS
jgi:small subunit ribosomal protein S14